jgi:RsmE family RNA methyltransferase
MVGQQLVAGRLDHEHGTATVVEVAAEHIVVTYQPDACPRSHPGRELILAVPRPKVLSRCLQHAAALGFENIALIRSYRVERAHLLSHKLSATDIRRHLLSGLEQARRVRLPCVQVFDRFKPFVEDVLPHWAQYSERFVAHPGAQPPPAGRTSETPRYTLAIGPEGGFVPYEVEALSQRGFLPISSPVGALRVESALSYFTGQLDGRALPRSG